MLDGAGADSAVTQALGSRRYQVTINGPGGHSFTDAGTPNPIAALARALAVLAETALPEEPRTTLNLGTIHGGTSVNSIPESAQAAIDLPLHRSGATGAAGGRLASRRGGRGGACECQGKIARGTRAARPLAFAIAKIGDRPAAQLPRDSPLLELCAPWTGIWACAPIFAWARPTPIFRCRWAFRPCPLAQAARRRRAHTGRVVLRQGPRSRPKAGTAADAGHAGVGGEQ